MVRYERVRDGRRINGDGIVHGVVLGDLEPEPTAEDGVIVLNGERWRRIE